MRSGWSAISGYARKERQVTCGFLVSKERGNVRDLPMCISCVVGKRQQFSTAVFKVWGSIHHEIEWDLSMIHLTKRNNGNIWAISSYLTIVE